MGTRMEVYDKDGKHAPSLDNPKWNWIKVKIVLSINKTNLILPDTLQWYVQKSGYILDLRTVVGLHLLYQ